MKIINLLYLCTLLISTQVLGMQSGPRTSVFSITTTRVQGSMLLVVSEAFKAHASAANDLENNTIEDVKEFCKRLMQETFAGINECIQYYLANPRNDVDQAALMAAKEILNDLQQAFGSACTFIDKPIVNSASAHSSVGVFLKRCQNMANNFMITALKYLPTPETNLTLEPTTIGYFGTKQKKAKSSTPTSVRESLKNFFFKPRRKINSIYVAPHNRNG